MTKKEYNREWSRNNRQLNKEKIAAYKRETRNDGHYTVYYLKEEHYVGMTSGLKHRLSYHKGYYNRYIEVVEIVGKYETKREALDVEAKLHSMGYLGSNKRVKKQTLKELI